MNHPFNDEELLVIFESARFGLADADQFDAVAVNLDLTDEYLVAVREKLQLFMEQKGDN